jgi:hypothetical protein
LGHPLWNKIWNNWNIHHQLLPILLQTKQA